MKRRSFLALTAASIAAPALPAFAATDARGVLQNWYKLVLELVRHTATYTPPVASRAFAYLGITAYEVLASGQAGYQTLAGQINGLAPLPPRPDGVFCHGHFVGQFCRRFAGHQNHAGGRRKLAGLFDVLNAARRDACDARGTLGQ